MLVPTLQCLLSYYQPFNNKSAVNNECGSQTQWLPCCDGASTYVIYEMDGFSISAKRCTVVSVEASVNRFLHRHPTRTQLQRAPVLFSSRRRQFTHRGKSRGKGKYMYEEKAVQNILTPFPEAEWISSLRILAQFMQQLLTTTFIGAGNK